MATTLPTSPRSGSRCNRLSWAKEKATREGGPREQIARLVGDLEEFSGDHGLARTVVVHVASTEAEFAPQAAWGSLDALEAALDAGVAQPASMIYAYAAISSGRPFVNFTPSIGLPAPFLPVNDRRGYRRHTA